MYNIRLYPVCQSYTSVMIGGRAMGVHQNSFIVAVIFIGRENDGIRRNDNEWWYTVSDKLDHLTFCIQHYGKESKSHDTECIGRGN
jgi:hypothetical protein